MTYKVMTPIQHDGEVFVPGEDFSGDEETTQALLAAGAIEEEKDLEEVLEPPPNYRDPDMRLGSGDPSVEGGAVLGIDLPTPTNVPQPMVIAKEPEPGTLGVGSPQRAVFQKMADRAKEESDQPSFEEMQEKRDEEQEGALTSGQQVGGQQDVEQAIEQAQGRRGARATVRPGKEEPSPAQKAAEGTQ